MGLGKVTMWEVTEAKTSWRAEVKEASGGSSDHMAKMPVGLSWAASWRRPSGV